MAFEIMYSSNKDPVDYKVLLQEYSRLIARIAHTIIRQCPASVELDDLNQAGAIGLIEAYQLYQKDKGASFTTYASIKIRYAMYEELRKQSSMSRELAQNIKAVKTTKASLIAQGESATHDEIANKMGISRQKYTEIAHQMMAKNTLSIDEVSEYDLHHSTSVHNPELQAELIELSRIVKEKIKQLGHKEQLILALYYNELLNFREIADILGLTEARVSQIHRDLLGKLKYSLTPFLDLPQAIE